jgi:hypothetical protein
LFLSALECDNDVIILVETNFNISISDAEVFDNRFLVYRCDRELGVDSVKCFQSEQLMTANRCEEVWIKMSLTGVNLFIGGVYLPHSAPDDMCGRHIESDEMVSGELGPNDLVLICGDYNLTNVIWSFRDGFLFPSNVTSAREAMVVDGRTACDMDQVNPFANRNGIFLDIVFSNNPDMLQVDVSDCPILGLDRHHPAFVLTCEVQYLKCTSMSKRISRFDFKRANVDAGWVLQPPCG